MSPLSAAIAALVLALALLIPSAPALAAGEDGSADCGGRSCQVGDHTGGHDGDQHDGDHDDGASNGSGTGEAPTCYAPSSDREIPCSVDGWSWSSSRGCYLKAISPQPAQGDTPEGWHPPMLGAGEGPGTWYDCANLYCAPLGILIGPCAGASFVWIADGEPTIDPRDAATAVAARLTVDPVDIGMAPRVNPDWGHRRTHVGVPVWMWVANPGQGSSQGWTVSDSEGGLTVSGTMRVASFQWDMGDGTKVTCGTAGQPYQAGFGWRESPDCGHVYSRTSAQQPGDRYTVTETTNWVFDWTAGGQSGSIPLSTTSTTEVEVNELQTVNTSPEG